MSNFQRVVLVHYHEIGLKGHNRSKFEKRLVDNIRTLTSGSPICAINRLSGRIVAYLKEGTTRAEQFKITDVIKNIPGVQRISCGFKCDRDYDLIKQLAITALSDAGDFETFKVQARRNHTDFEPNSQIMNKEVGATLCRAFPDKGVRMKNPDVQVNVEVIQNMAFVCAFSSPGVGGLPVGVSGKVMCMLSSGIDSPVATWKMAKRGATCIGVHFSGRPQTSDASEYLVRDIAEKLNERGCMQKFYVCPIGDYQREISLLAPPELRVVLYRRLMFRISSALGDVCGAKAIATGESLGQVASQTLDNMIATSDASKKIVFRPCIGMDKLEIISEAEALRTFEISSQDAPDCCTLFMPRNPETHAKLDQVREVESTIFKSEWVDEIVNNAEEHLLKTPQFV